MNPQNPFLSLLKLLTLFIYASSTLPLSSSFSSVTISETSNQTLICALTTQSNLNCSGFGLGTHNPIPSPNAWLSGIVAGDGFVCFLRYPSPASVSSIGCYRFSGNGTDLTQKRIYRGAELSDLEAGNSHICGIVRGSGNLTCWQWPGFTPPNVQNFTDIAVGEEFVCGLLESGQIKCFGTNPNVVGKEPVGSYSSIKAGLQQACAISIDGTMVNCWGQTATTLNGSFSSLAVGDNRGCALQSPNGTVLCWGENNYALPESLRGAFFVSITGEKLVFCGVFLGNYSLICWGGENFGSGTVIFGTVMPGPCQTECQCGRQGDYGSFCSQGYICLPCTRHQPPPAFQAAPPKSSSSVQRIAFWVIGSVGSASLLVVFGFFIYLFSRRHGCRVHDSGRLERTETTPAPEQGVVVAQIPPEEPELFTFQFTPTQGSKSEPARVEKFLHQLASLGSFKMEKFTLEELQYATGNFSDDYKIGYGSYGSVYRAKLQDGRDVAIKRAELKVSGSPLRAAPGGIKRQEDQDHAFLSEIANLSRLNHKNLVRLYGFCDEANERVLVYEFMVNGTLYDHLHNLQDSPLLSWPARIKVALDAARGIEYLHTYAVPQLIHRDIKSSNILLDDQWVARVSDFGLSLMGPDNDDAHLSLRAAGTVGYMDPAYYKFQQLTTKSDVYSFGVVLIELLSGCKAIHRNKETGLPRNVVDYIVPYIVRDEIHRVLDPKLAPPSPSEIEAVTYVGYIAADCVVSDGRDRPTMSEIVSSLERALAAACVTNPSLSRSTTTGSTIREE